MSDADDTFSEESTETSTFYPPPELDLKLRFVKGGFILNYPVDRFGAGVGVYMTTEIFTSPGKLNSKLRELIKEFSQIPEKQKKDTEAE